MPIGNITQSVSVIPAAPHRGVDVQTVFVTKQEDFQDHLQGTTVTELNTLKDQLNTRIGEINSTVTTMNGYADTASAGASTATTKAGEASASASGALTSKNQAETFKNNASTSASTATTKASEASASALSASTSASTATTKASEASASASQALTSRNQAEAFAQQASASALSVDVNNLVHRTGDETVGGVKTFSSNIVGNITGNSGTATKLTNSSGDWSGSGAIANVVGMLSWKNYGNGHAIFDASNSTTPNGVAVNNTNPQFPWSPTSPTLMGWNGGQTFGVRVDSARYSETCTGNAATATIAADSNKLVGKNWYWSGQGGQPAWLWGGSDGANMYVYNPANFNVNTAVSLSTAVGSAPSYACRAWVNFNGTGTVAIRASGNVSSITDNGVGDYTVNFTTAMSDANYSISSVCTGGNNLNFGGARLSSAPLSSSFRYCDANTSTGYLQDEAYQFISIFR